MAKAKSAARKRQAAYVLSTSLIKRVRKEAADLEVYPASIVEERLRESYERKPTIQPSP